jgi:hypothetical protein
MVPDWSFFIKAPGSTQITIFCVTGTLDASLVDQNRDLMVFAQDLVISGPLSLPGRRVRILAKTVTMQNSASINVSGTDGQSFQPGYRSPRR